MTAVVLVYLLVFSVVGYSTLASVNKISWTLSKPPANLFRWETDKQNPSYTLTSLSPGAFVLQAIAQDTQGTSTHSGVIQGNITTTQQTIQVILNPLIQADAARFQQPSYIKWVKTNSTTVYPGDKVELTVKGQSNPPNSDMQFTFDSQVKCTTKDECVYVHTIPETASDPFVIQCSIVGMGYTVPMELKLLAYVPVEFRAVFNVPPSITAINSAISLLHQIGTSTTVSATFSDAEGSNVKYTWTTEALQGSCPITELSGTLTDTVASGSTVSVVFTPTTLGNKCIVKIRCEDSQGAASLGEVYIYVDNIPIYFPPYVVSKLQSKQTASIGDDVDFSLEMCEPQAQMVTVAWSTSCGSLDSAADTITASTDCHWIYNKLKSITSLPCTVTWTATDSDSSVSTGTFRILEDSRRLRMLEREVPIVRVVTRNSRLTTIMDWSDPPETKTTLVPVEQEGMTGEGIALIAVCCVILVGSVGVGIAMKMRKVECVIPADEKKPTVEKEEKKDVKKNVEMKHINKMTELAFAKSNVNKFTRTRRQGRKATLKKTSPRRPPPPSMKEEDGDEVDITPEMIAKGARRQMQLKRNSTARKMHIAEVKNKMLPAHDMGLRSEGEAHNDFEWESRIKHHNGIDRHPRRK